MSNVSNPPVIDEREHRGIEFKREVTKGFLKVADAFANYGDGRILFGVDDDGIVVGLECDLDEQCLAIEQLMNDSISPRPQFLIDSDPRRRTIVLTVLEGPNKPYLYRGRAYRRQDTSTVEVDRLELRRLTLEGTNQTFDALPSQEQDLSFEALDAALKTRLGLTEVTLDIYRTLGLYSAKSGYLNAAAILADANDFAGVDVIRFGPDTSIIHDRHRIIGCSALVQLEETLDLIREFSRAEAIIGATREQVELVPEVAYREALANAIAHRQWDSRRNVQVSLFTDHIEVLSPGPLPNEVSAQEYLESFLSIPRNPILAEVLHRLGYIELFGTGVGKIIAAYRGLATLPSFSLTDHAIIVDLPVVQPGGRTMSGMTDTMRRVLEVLDGWKALSRSEIERMTGLSRLKVLEALRMLQQPGTDYVERIGNGPSTKYILRH